MTTAFGSRSQLARLSISVACAIALGASLGACGSDDEEPSRQAPASDTVDRDAAAAAEQREREQLRRKRAQARQRAEARRRAKQRRVRERRAQRRREARARRREQRAEAAAAAEAEASCHPSYDPCLDPSVSDYDCAGGSGDGPGYTGRVTVTGPDDYGLDSDGDGVGCES